MPNSSDWRTAKDIARRELIGLSVIVRSPHAGWDGLEGRLVDETKGTFLVETADGRTKRVPKRGQRFEFRETGSLVVLQGSDLELRPEERTKKFRLNR